MRRNSVWKKFLNILNDIKFKGLNLNNPEKVILWGLIFSFISLYFPWVIEKSSNWVDQQIFSWFHEKVWKPWITITIILLFVVFNLFSREKKEKIKLYSNLRFSNNSVYINTWILISIISIICFNFVSALSTYSSYIESWNWPILCLTWWIAILLAWFFNKTSNEKINTYINDTEENDSRENNDKINNMKLPF